MARRTFVPAPAVIQRSSPDTGSAARQAGFHSEFDMFVHDHAGHAPSPRFPRAVRGTPLWLDGVIALLLFIGAATGGLSYWKRTVAGGQPFYYQNYFEPAVMIGCGKGFVVARPQVPAMVP